MTARITIATLRQHGASADQVATFRRLFRYGWAPITARAAAMARRAGLDLPWSPWAKFAPAHDPTLPAEAARQTEAIRQQVDALWDEFRRQVETLRAEFSRRAAALWVEHNRITDTAVAAARRTRAAVDEGAT